MAMMMKRLTISLMHSKDIDNQWACFSPPPLTSLVPPFFPLHLFTCWSPSRYPMVRMMMAIRRRLIISRKEFRSSSTNTHTYLINPFVVCFLLIIVGIVCNHESWHETFSSSKWRSQIWLESFYNLVKIARARGPKLIILWLKSPVSPVVSLIMIRKNKLKKPTLVLCLSVFEHVINLPRFHNWYHYLSNTSQFVNERPYHHHPLLLLQLVDCNHDCKQASIQIRDIWVSLSDLLS